MPVYWPIQLASYTADPSALACCCSPQGTLSGSSGPKAMSASFELETGQYIVSLPAAETPGLYTLDLWLDFEGAYRQPLGVEQQIQAN
eukprot:scaffold620704_cov53-Prasinocladus_malaysianus.AAC.1